VTRPGGSLSAAEEATAYGIDVSILDANLQLTPMQRLIAHQKALEAALAVREAGARYYAGRSTPSHDPH
jgi:pheromone shutdown protein TraB